MTAEEDPPSTEPEAAQSVTEALTEMGKAIDQRDDTLTGMIKRGRRTSRWLIVSIAFDVLLTFGIGWLASAYHANSNLQVAVLCQSSNSSHASNQILWDRVLNSIDGLPPEEKARLIGIVAKQDRHKMCTPGSLATPTTTTKGTQHGSP